MACRAGGNCHRGTNAIVQRNDDNENDDRPGESQLHHDEGGRGGVDGAKGQRQ